MPKTAKALVTEFEQIWAQANSEGRDLTAVEREQVQELVDAANQKHQIEQDMKGLSPLMGAPSSVWTDPTASSQAADRAMYSSSRKAGRALRTPRTVARPGPPDRSRSPGGSKPRTIR
jgi:hypothetical protein